MRQIDVLFPLYRSQSMGNKHFLKPYSFIVSNFNPLRSGFELWLGQEDLLWPPKLVSIKSSNFSLPCRVSLLIIPRTLCYPACWMSTHLLLTFIHDSTVLERPCHFHLLRICPNHTFVHEGCFFLHVSIKRKVCFALCFGGFVSITLKRAWWTTQ